MLHPYTCLRHLEAAVTKSDNEHLWVEIVNARPVLVFTHIGIWQKSLMAPADSVSATGGFELCHLETSDDSYQCFCHAVWRLWRLLFPL